MKVLLIHTEYQQKGGEDEVFRQDLALLRESEEVRTLVLHNQFGWRGALQFAVSIWNRQIAKQIKDYITEFNPDVIHIYNWHFAIGPLAIRIASETGTPIVLGIQNFRLLCPSGTLLHNGKMFTSSLRSSFPWTAVANGVYRNSVLQTFWLSAIIWFHKKIGTWNKIDRYIVATQVAKDTYVDSSLSVPEFKFVVKPNFIDAPNLPNTKRSDHFLFIGRLSVEKGIASLLSSFSRTNYKLTIAGDGPLKDSVLQAASTNKNITYVGALNKAQVLAEMQRCTALVFPSVWYEGMPMTILEAFSLGTPVIASNLGAMSTMIRHNINGLHFEADNIDELTSRLNTWHELSADDKNQYSKNTVDIYEQKYTPEKVRRQLLEIYQSAIQDRRNLGNKIEVLS